VDALHREIARRITAAMKRKDMTVNKLADFAGLGRGSMSEILRGKRSPTVKTLAKIAAALDVEVRDLMPSGK
jgi:transcriptional regulator with XRE-family HTH domain